jgi:hypothetical protein
MVFLALIGCGGEPVKPVPPSKNPSQQLLDQIARIEPKLLFCRGMWAGVRPHYLTKKPNCDTGDGMLWTGLYLLSDPINASDLRSGIRYSVGLEGRPYRSPENIDYGEHKNSFSRDMLFGLLFYTIKTKDTELIQRFYNYARNNDYNMCPLDTDGRCFMTPGSMELLGDVFEHVGLRRYSDMQSLGGINEVAIEIEAENTPEGYPMHLSSLSIYLKALTGRLTTRHQNAAAILYRRQPENLWFRFLNNYVSNGDQAEYEEICRLLIERMERWPDAEKADWIWQRAQDSKEFKLTSGHELVWLAKLLTGVL